MGYYSTVKIAVTKKGYEKIIKDQEKYKEYKLLDFFEINYFGKNDSLVLMETLESIKFYNEYEDIEQLRKTLSKLKDGYVFARLGEEYLDLEFLNEAKTKELLEPFEFVKELADKINNEYKKNEEEEEEFG